MRFKPSRRDRDVFGKIASEYDLTYFGTATPEEESDYLPVMGLTASPEQTDDNYVSGMVAGYPVKLLQRSHDIYTPDNRKIYRTWSICNIKLHRARLPRVIIGGLNKPDRDGFVLASYLRIYEISPQSLGDKILPRFARNFAIYVSPSDIDALRRILTRDLQVMLFSYFDNVDFEIDVDDLYIYNTKSPITLVDLDKMIRVAVWIARLLDSQSNKYNE